MGNYVVIKTGGYYITYMHMYAHNDAVVVKGSEVNQGASIGLVGDTGDATGPHLHIGIGSDAAYTNTNTFDPLPFFN
jgi:murein DD-endopeptidase MepM/ murein hydrolase activator NlpD